MNSKSMKIIVSIGIVFSLTFISCQVESDCGCSGSNTTETNNSNRFATIMETTDGYQLFSDEDGFLSPCEKLDPELRVNGKPVLISGMMKQSCKTIDPNFPINPVQLGMTIPLDHKYDRLDITLTIIKSEDYGYAEGFGFIVEDNRTVGGTKLLQATIGGVAGNQVYDTELKAYLNGLLVVYGVRNATTEVSPETLRYIKVIN